MNAAGSGKSRICFVVAPQGQTGGGMGRVKDYILQSGGDRLGRVHFVALDTRGSGRAAWSVLLVLAAIARIYSARLLGRLALVHVNLGDRGSAARKGLIIVMARLIGVPVVLHLHAAELTDTYDRAGGVLKALIRLPFHMATCCLVLGERWRGWLADELGVDPGKIAILYNGVPGPPGNGPVIHVPAGPPRQILFLGNLLERKGLSDLLHALQALPPDAPAWEAVIAGGGDIDKYRRLADELGLGARVRFVGWVDQAGARALLQAASLLALPSYDEGLPLVILEALGNATPVLCTPVGSIPEVLHDGETACFVPPGDRPALSRALLSLLRDDGLRERLSRQGNALFRSQFTLEAFITRLFELYRTLCGVEIEPAFPGPAATRAPNHAMTERTIG